MVWRKVSKVCLDQSPLQKHHFHQQRKPGHGVGTETVQKKQRHKQADQQLSLLLVTECLRRPQPRAIKEATSRLVHLEKVSLNVPNSSSAIRVNLLHP